MSGAPGGLCTTHSRSMSVPCQSSPATTSPSTGTGRCTPLPDTARTYLVGVSSSCPCPGGRRGRSSERAVGGRFPSTTRIPSSSSGSASEACCSPRAPQLSALLALQAAGHLPRHRQWFVSMDHGSARCSMAEIRRVEWIPGWSVNRARPDGRRPSRLVHQPPARWGVPIPFFIHKETGALHPRTDDLAGRGRGHAGGARGDRGLVQPLAR